MENRQKQKVQWPHIGNEHITEYLTRSIQNDAIAHSYLFLGPAGLGKTTVSNHFAKILLCEFRAAGQIEVCGKCRSCLFLSKKKSNGLDLDFAHSDFHLVKKDPEKKEISIDQIREFVRVLGMSSFSNSYKIGIIKGAEDLSEKAANALLKTMEEPTRHTVIIMISDQADSILPTLVSRSQPIYFRPVQGERIYDYLLRNHGASRDDAKELSRLAIGRPALAVKLLEDKVFRKEHMDIVHAFVDMFTIDLNDRFERVNKLFSVKASTGDSVIFGMRVLSIWESLLRDITLTQTGNENLVQHSAFMTRLKDISDSMDHARITKIFDMIQESRLYIQSNLKPRLVLENLSINI